MQSHEIISALPPVQPKWFRTRTQAPVSKTGFFSDVISIGKQGAQLRRAVQLWYFAGMPPVLGASLLFV